MFNKLIKHFTYPTTWQSIVVGAATVGLTLAPEWQGFILTVGPALFAGIGFFFSDADVDA